MAANTFLYSLTVWGGDYFSITHQYDGGIKSIKTKEEKLRLGRSIINSNKIFGVFFVLNILHVTSSNPHILENTTR